MTKHYFDYAASTPVDPAVVKAMTPFWAEKFGNPGSLHSFGQEASAAVFEARDTIAKSLGCHYSEIVFTGSATEANNLALRGVVESLKLKVESIKNPKIITSAIEHDSILGTCRELEKDGVEVVYLPVSKNGIVDLKKLESALDDRTVLVSIMYANNEIGTVQPISKISEIIKKFRSNNLKSAYPLLHTDAVQAFNYLNCNVNDFGTKSAKGGSPEHFAGQNVLGVDLLTLSSQKIYGPKGVGALYVRTIDIKQLTSDKKNSSQRSMVKGQWLSPLVTGGGQENGMRAGTENVPGIVGFAKAVELTDKIREKENKRLSGLQEYFLKQIKKVNPKIELNGDAKNRLPNNINLYIPAKSGNKGSAQDLVIALDMAGFAVSPGSACSARVCSPSHVLKALGHSDEKAMSGLRITFGRQTDKKAIDSLLKTMDKLIRKV